MVIVSRATSSARGLCQFVSLTETLMTSSSPCCEIVILAYDPYFLIVTLTSGGDPYFLIEILTSILETSGPAS
jgi:hypothetical protein